MWHKDFISAHTKKVLVSFTDALDELGSLLTFIPYTQDVLGPTFPENSNVIKHSGFKNQHCSTDMLNLRLCTCQCNHGLNSIWDPMSLLKSHHMCLGREDWIGLKTWTFSIGLSLQKGAGKIFCWLNTWQQVSVDKSMNYSISSYQSYPKVMRQKSHEKTFLGYFSTQNILGPAFPENSNMIKHCGFMNQHFYNRHVKPHSLYLWMQSLPEQFTQKPSHVFGCIEDLDIFHKSESAKRGWQGLLLIEYMANELFHKPLSKLPKSYETDIAWKIILGFFRECR